MTRRIKNSMQKRHSPLTFLHCRYLLYSLIFSTAVSSFFIAVVFLQGGRSDGSLSFGSTFESTTELPEMRFSNATGKKTITWDEWPAVAQETVGVPLVTKGNSFFHHAREFYFRRQPNRQMLIEEFLEVYKNRPDPVNLCGIRINHAMALFLAVKQIEPSLVIESGVNAGVSTYFIRAASPTTKIFAIDPLETPICGQEKRWTDSSSLTKYYTGKNFVDLMELDWKGMTEKKDVDPNSTLVFIDDHLHAFNRIAGVMKFGVRHVVVEDNYKYGEGATQNDKKSTPKQFFFGNEWKKEGEWLFKNIVSYAEFPPLVPPIMAKAFTGERKKAGGFMVASDDNTDVTHPILRPDLNAGDMKIYTDIAEKLGIDPTLKDEMSYMQVMNYNQICHLELF
jgi:hypothetical protein